MRQLGTYRFAPAAADRIDAVVACACAREQSGSPKLPSNRHEDRLRKSD
jgi:hypothetical protein